MSMKKVLLLALVLSSLFLSACSTTASVGSWCDLVPDSVCIFRGKFTVAKAEPSFDLGKATVVFYGEAFLPKSGTYKATISVDSQEGKPIASREIEYNIEGYAAKLNAPAGVERWIHEVAEGQSVTINLVSQKVRIVVLDPYASSGKLVSILLYDDIPISSTVTRIEPTKGCWYNEVLCSPDEFKYRRTDGE